MSNKPCVPDNDKKKKGYSALIAGLTPIIVLCLAALVVFVPSCVHKEPPPADTETTSSDIVYTTETTYESSVISSSEETTDKEPPLETSAEATSSDTVGTTETTCESSGISGSEETTGKETPPETSAETTSSDTVGTTETTHESSQTSGSEETTGKEPPLETSAETTSPTPPVIPVLNVRMENPNAVLVKEAIRRYMELDMTDPRNAKEVPDNFREAPYRIDTEETVSLNFSVADATAICYEVIWSKDPLFKNAVTEIIPGSSATYRFSHLFADTTYYYQVTAYTSAGTIISKKGSFKTADTPRILSIDGIYNVRDIGNKNTSYGKKVKQGLLYRGTELDGAVEKAYYITNDGIADMLFDLGIKTDMDLRAETPESKDALGARVNHYYYDMFMYNAIFLENGKDRVRAVFSDLANRDNYPIYMHCTYGCDRTGVVSYLLLAFLGVSEDDCLKDYGLSNMQIENIMLVRNRFEAYAGDDLKSKVTEYLLSCGITFEQLEEIKNIFLGD